MRQEVWVRQIREALEPTLCILILALQPPGVMYLENHRSRVLLNAHTYHGLF
jgi:hypothetical protein